MLRLLLWLELSESKRREDKVSDSTFDLGTFSQLPISVVDTDASGNLVQGAPNAVFTASDATVVTLSDQPDGSTVAVRVSDSAGSVVITATVTNADGSSASGTLTLSLAAVVQPVANVTDVQLVPGTPS